MERGSSSIIPPIILRFEFFFANFVRILAEVIASKSGKVVKIGKEAFYKQLEMPLEEAYKYTSEVMTKNMMILDAKEGINAFLKKRKPIFFLKIGQKHIFNG